MNPEALFARIISVVLHPMLIPTFGTWLLFNLESYLTYKIDPALKIQLYLLVFINTFIFPSLITLILVKTGLVSDLSLTHRKERRWPYLITLVFYFITYYLLRNAQLPALYLNMLLGAALAVLLTLIINSVWKISAHMIGMGGVTGAILAVALRLPRNLAVPLAIAFILSGIVAYARLRLSAHSEGEVYTGFAVGFITQFLLILYI